MWIGTRRSFLFLFQGTAGLVFILRPWDRMRAEEGFRHLVTVFCIPLCMWKQSCWPTFQMVLFPCSKGGFSMVPIYILTVYSQNHDKDTIERLLETERKELSGSCNFSPMILNSLSLFSDKPDQPSSCSLQQYYTLCKVHFLLSHSGSQNGRPEGEFLSIRPVYSVIHGVHFCSSVITKGKTEVLSTKKVFQGHINVKKKSHSLNIG